MHVSINVIMRRVHNVVDAQYSMDEVRQVYLWNSREASIGLSKDPCLHRTCDNRC